MIPQGWNLVLLEDIADVIDPHPSHRAPSIVKDGVPFVGIGDIDVQGNIDLTSVRRVSQDTAIEHEKNYSIIDGDLAFGRVASIGKVIRLKRFEFKYAISPTLAIIKPKKEYKNILPFLLQADITQNQFEKIKSGSTRSSVGMLTLRKLELLMPTEKERNIISKILSTCDEAIEKLSKLIATKEKQKKGLMQNLLTGKVRFKKYSNTNWSYNKLGELSIIRRGASPRPISDPKFFSIKGRGWIRISDVSAEEGKYLNRTTQYLSSEGENNSVKVDKGDLIMSICATIGLPKIINIPSCIHDGFVLIKPIEGKLHTDFLYHYINFITNKLAEGGQPGTQKNLNTDIVSRIQVPLIEINEQNEIANVLDQAENEILILKKELIKLKSQKKGLMQQLLTGKIRVKI